MPLRWGWIGLLTGLVVLAIVLAWLDSTVLRPIFPESVPGPRRFEIARSVEPGVRLAAVGRPDVVFRGFGPAGGLYSFWWFLSVGVAVALVALAALLALPSRARRAAERVTPATLPLMFAAGVATVLLGLALTVLLRVGFVLVSILPVLYGVALLGAVFGVAGLALAAGGWLRGRLGSAPPLVAALAGLLVLFDASLVPVAGWFVLAVVAVTSLGLAVLTRLGSPSGWSLDELNL